MALPSDYISGTITLTNGSTAFTGTGTGWLAADFREGDIIFDVEGGEGAVAVIASITSNTAGVLSKEWEGPTLTDVAYRMRYQWDSGRVSAQSRAAIEMLGNGNLQSFASLTGPGVPVFDGPHSVTIKPESDFVNGVAYDVQVDTLADRDAYDGQSEGFAVLVSDVGDGRSALYSKNSNAVGDWSDPAYITGPVGPLPDVEATVTSLPPGSTATVTEVPITGGVRLDFELPEASGFYNAGVYNIAEAYNQDDVVRHNGSSFIALQAVPVGESPSSASPPVDTAYWQVLAAKGQDGNITGVTPFWQSRILNDDDAAEARMGLGAVGGPAGGVADGDLVAFDGGSGGLVKKAARVANAQLATMETARFKARATAGTGDPEDITTDQAKALLNIGWETIQKVNVTSPVASVNFLNLGAYRSLRATFRVLPSVDGAALYARVSADNGASFNATPGAYSLQRLFSGGTTVGAVRSTAETGFNLYGGGNAANEGSAGMLILHDWDLAMMKFGNIAVVTKNPNGDLEIWDAGAQYIGLSTLNALQFINGSGSIAAGSYFVLEGIKA